MKGSKELAKDLLEAALRGEEIDLYQQDPSDWDFLAELIPELVVTSAGGYFPFQAQGTLQGFPFYFRARGEWATLHLSAPGDDPVGFDLLYYAGMSVPFGFGVQDFCETMLKLVPALQRSPFRWKFSGYKLDLPVKNSWEAVRTDQKEISVGWGHTPEEGWAQTQEISEYLLEHGCTEEVQRKHLELKAVSKTPLNQDTRVFPEVDPVFSTDFRK